MKPITGVLNETWKVYSARAIFSSASDLQRLECRRAFFAGAQTLLAALHNADAQKVNSLADEIEAFFAEVQAGRS